MIDIIGKALERGLKLGANYVDVRVEKQQSELVMSEDGKPKEASFSIEDGVGARALAGGSWGFSAMQLKEETENQIILRAVEDAVKLAKAVKNSSSKIELAEVKPFKDVVKAKFKIDPKGIALEEKMNFCTEASDRIIKYDPAVKKSSSAIVSLSTDKTFSSSEGAVIQESQIVVLGILHAQAVEGNASEYYSHTTGGVGGFEALKEYDLVEHSEEIAEKAVALVKAPPAPTKKLPVILDQEFASILSHEILGHPSEADRIIGKEAAWAGRSWWNGKTGEKMFSDKLTVVSDATLGGYLGSFKYDDEGVPAKRIVHIDKGFLRGFLHSRETAKIFNVEPNGTMRAMSYLFAPLIRMTNTYVEKGDWKFDEMLEGIKEGIYLKGEKIPSIDSRRYNFQISAKEAYMIYNGELSELRRSPTLTGTSKEFLSSIDAIGDDLIIFPIPNCGKGEPMQTMRVGNGGPHMRGIGMVTGPR
ncbi:MAG: TldD protein [Thermoproteota archaeon]|nr:TldD protein [Thermoproteota archaeon]